MGTRAEGEDASGSGRPDADLPSPEPGRPARAAQEAPATPTEIPGASALDRLGIARQTIPASTSGPRPSEAIDGTEGDTLADVGDTLDESLSRPGAPSPFAGLLAEAKAVPDGAEPNSKGPGTLKVRDRVPLRAPAPLPRTPAPSPGTERRIGPYRVLEELGSGGMAVVYKAVQPALDRLVAIKELRAEYVHDRQIATRFEREATSLATMQHGNIVHVYDYLRDEEAAYIVMELVEGIDLFDVLAETGRVPVDIAALLALQIAEGLEYAHYRGIIHRDIKPSNILVSKRGELKIMDFGIARDPGKSELTQIGLAVGTPAYMAPEQIRGDKIDFRTDVFALGIVLYEMLAGEKPWPEEEGRAITVKVLDDPPRPIRSVVPDVPIELERVIQRCLAKDPEQRYRSTYELRRDLELYVQRTVLVDPRGRIVLFLRNRGFITEAETSSFVDLDRLNDASVRRRDEGVPLPPAQVLLRPVAVAFAAAFLVVGVAGLLAAFAPVGDVLSERPPFLSISGSNDAARIDAEIARRLPAAVERHIAELRATDELPPGDRPARDVPRVAPALTGQEGFVKVVVKPWARVFVDGELFDSTPFADPVPLAPGRHRIGLRNPYFEPVDRFVDVSTGQTIDLKVSLIPRGGEDVDEER